MKHRRAEPQYKTGPTRLSEDTQRPPPGGAHYLECLLDSQKLTASLRGEEEEKGGRGGGGRMKEEGTGQWRGKGAEERTAGVARERVGGAGAESGGDKLTGIWAREQGL